MCRRKPRDSFWYLLSSIIYFIWGLFLCIPTFDYWLRCSKKSQSSKLMIGVLLPPFDRWDLVFISMLLIQFIRLFVYFNLSLYLQIIFYFYFRWIYILVRLVWTQWMETCTHSCGQWPYLMNKLSWYLKPCIGVKYRYFVSAHYFLDYLRFNVQLLLGQ